MNIDDVANLDKCKKGGGFRSGELPARAAGTGDFLSWIILWADFTVDFWPRTGGYRPAARPQPPGCSLARLRRAGRPAMPYHSHNFTRRERRKNAFHLHECASDPVD